MSQKNEQNKEENNETKRSRRTAKKLPLASQLIKLPVTLLAAFLHLIAAPLGIEPALAMFISGGFFGMILIDILFAIGIMNLAEVIFPHAKFFIIRFFLLPFVVFYVVGTLLMDKQHLKVKDSDPIPARNFLERASRSFFSASLDYFPSTCVAWVKDKDSAKLPPSNQYVFACHPHGIHCIPLAQFSTPGSDFDLKFPGLVGHKLTGLCASVMFKLPMVREFFLDMGYVDASRPVANQVLQEGRSIYVCTGGEEESMYTTTGQDIVVLKKRKGFVRLALSHGAQLVPVFGVGNNDLYTTYDFMTTTRRWLQKKFHVALPIFHGRWCTPLPYKQPLRVLIGKPIVTPTPVVKGERPDEALVDEYHAKYMEALSALHAEHVSDRKLQII